MNNPFDQISGQIIIKGRAYSAKEVIRGLLEQGIAITEGSEGLKIGFKLFSPESISYQNTTLEGNSVPNCPFIPYMSQITSQLEELTARLNNQHNTEEISPSDSAFPSAKAEDPPSSAFSPFNTSFFQSRNEEEKDQFFSASNNFFENRQKCPSCGATIPQNAFFCNKCGKHVRSG
jgi:ribosomal protein L40E